MSPLDVLVWAGTAVLVVIAGSISVITVVEVTRQMRKRKEGDK